MRKNRTTAQTLSLPVRLIYMRYAAVIWAGLAVLLILASGVASDKIDHVRIRLADMTAPLLQTVSKPFTVLSKTVNDMSGMSALRAENLRLSEENRRLQEWYQNALKLQAENQSLRDFLNVAAEPDRAYLTTRVISDPGGRFVKSFLVPTGAREGVENGQAVVTDKGLIGRITETGQNTARVLMITDLNSRIPVMVEETHHRAVLAGQNTPDLVLNHLPVDSGVAVGSRIVTSGHDGILPPNIPVGIVSEVSEKGVTVVPLSDMDRIHFVQVIAVADHPMDSYFLDQTQQQKP